jgi:surface protein
MSDWGKGVNNDIGWGQGGTNDIGWGSIYDKSNSGLTLLLKDNTAFIIEVDTTKAGTPSDQFQFTGALGDYDVVAKQNGTQVATFNDLSGAETITLPSSGIYDLEVSAKEVNGFNRIAFNNGGDKLKITDIIQWGTIVWSSFRDAFYACRNLIVNATDIPDLSQVNDLSSIFRYSTSANPDVSNWDLSSVTNMSNMFRDASSANPDVSNWTFFNTTDISGMFRGASSANPNARDWDASKFSRMDKIFSSSNISVENLTACYENWSQLQLQQNVSFSAGSTKYNSSGQAGRDILVNTYNWIIEDGGLV